MFASGITLTSLLVGERLTRARSAHALPLRNSTRDWKRILLVFSRIIKKKQWTFVWRRWECSHQNQKRRTRGAMRRPLQPPVQDSQSAASEQWAQHNHAEVGNSETFLSVYCANEWIIAKLRLKCDGTRAETRFCLLAKRTSPFKSAGASVQSTIGSRGVRISGSNAACTMFRGSLKSTDYTLNPPVSPSLPLPCVTVCHHISTGLYHWDTYLTQANVVTRRSLSHQC
jgi:hypothetical protein